MTTQKCDYGCGQQGNYWFQYSKKWCCSKHANSCPERRRVIQIYNNNNKEARQNTLMTKYGVTNPRHIAGVNDKIKYTCISKYGVDNPNKSEEIRLRGKQTSLQKYGVESPNQSANVKLKKRESYLNKYGVDHPLKCPEVYQKVRSTFLERYGVPQIWMSQQWRESIFLSNLGVTHPSFRGDIINKQQQTNLDRYGSKCYFSSETWKKIALEKGLIIDPNFKEGYELYHFRCWQWTNHSLSRHVIDNIEKRSRKFHLDHKVSIKHGYEHGVLPIIIGSWYNLEVIPSSVNCSKKANCSITIDELVSAYYQSPTL